MKRTKFLLFSILFALLAVCCASGISDIVFFDKNNSDGNVCSDKTSVGLMNEETPSSYRAESLYFDNGTSLIDHNEVTNLVIFIYFNDENVEDFLASVTKNGIVEKFNGGSDSLYNYYHTISYGTFSAHSYSPTVYNPYNGTHMYFTYKAPYARSYYQNVSAESGTARYDPESILLNGAVSAADEYITDSDLNLDVNDDGLVDSVSFVVSGTYNNPGDWGKLMWPHAWELNRISNISSSKCDSATINGLNVGNYTFTFVGNFTLGLIAHEFGHLLGLPDLYHYEYDTKYLPVGYWDLMHLECSRPQFMLTYMRYKYLNFVSKNQIKELTSSGTYSLTPTALSTADDLLAYKISISATESVWIEYRTANQFSYDAELPGSGLIVYRINNTVTGNTDGKHHSIFNPDEIYIYRPDCAPLSVKSTSEKEKYNLARAAVSLKNVNFKSIGSSSATGIYNSNCIYLTNGSNTGISLTIDEESDDSITFTIDLGEYDCNALSDAYIMGTDLEGKSVKNRHHMLFGEQPDISVYLQYKGRPSIIEVCDFTVEYNPSPCEEGQIAYAVFYDGNEEQKIPFTLFIYDTMLSGAEIISPPDKTTYSIGDKLSLNGLVISVEYSSGLKQQIAYSDENASLWTILEGIDMSVHGNYDNIKIKYGDNAMVILSGIKVLSAINSIKISETNTQHIKCATLVPYYTVIATYDDGTEGILPPEEFSVSLGIGETEYKTVRITSNENPDAYCKSYYYDMGVAKATDATLKGTTSFNLIFGEEPDLSETKVSVAFSNGLVTEDLPLENYRYAILSKLNIDKVGTQTVTVPIDSARFSINCAVSAKNNNILTNNSSFKKSDSIIINNERLCVVIKENLTLSEFINAFSSYLTVSFVDRENSYELYSGAHGNRNVGYNMKIQLKTESGFIATEYSVYRLGDANGDGIIQSSDKANWLESLLIPNGTYKCEFDANFDLRYTLTDFVILNDTENP